MPENDPITLLGWVDEDQDDFNNFRLAYSEVRYNPGAPAMSTPIDYNNQQHIYYAI